MASPNTDFDDLAATTIDKYSSELADNVTNAIPLWAYLKENGNLKSGEVDGGLHILENLAYGENGNFKWFNGYELLDVTPSEMVTAASFDWKECNANVVFNGREVAINSGSDTKKFDLIETRTKNTERTLANNMGAAVYYAGTENDGKSIGGLQLLVADAPTSGTVGGINRATAANAFWRNQYYDFSANSVVSGASTILPALNKLHRDCLRGADKPNLVILGDTYYGYLETALTAQQRFTTVTKKIGVGFDTIRFHQADLIYDPNCAATRGYMLNLDYIKVRAHSAVNMKTGKPKHPTNQNSTIIPINWMGNLTISNPSLQGVIHE